MATRSAQLKCDKHERHLFSLEEYERMVEAGAFDEDAGLELIRGEILDLAPISDSHAFGVSNLVKAFARQVSRSAIIWVRSPIQVGANSLPEPDVALLQPRPDLSPKSPPTASDVIVVVEVADTSIGRDRGVKRSLYAEAGIPEYWIVNLRDGVIEVYTNPARATYKQVRQARPGDTLPLPAGVEGTVAVSDILGGEYVGS